MIKMLSGNEKYIFSRFQLYTRACAYMDDTPLLILRLPQHQKCHVLYSFESFQRSLEHPQTLFFGNFWTSSEVAGMFSEILIITGQKSHAFDLEKVGSYELELAMVS